MNCPVCTATEDGGRVLQRHDGYRLYECGRCRVQFWWPAGHPGTQWYEESDIYGYRRFGTSRSRVFWRHRQFLEGPSTQGELLDIGCGRGAFLAAAQDAGYSVSGIDLDGAAIHAAQSLGLQDTWALPWEEFVAHTDRRFDVITFFEFLEHLDNHGEFIQSVKGLLRPAGHIAVSVPNRRRWKPILNLAGIDLPPHHLTRWDADSLTNFLDSAGFDVVVVREQQMDTECLLNCMHQMLPYRVIWQRTGRLLATQRRHPHETTLNVSGQLLARTMRVLRLMHRVALTPCAAMGAFILRRCGRFGTGLYAYARLRDS